MLCSQLIISHHVHTHMICITFHLSQESSSHIRRRVVVQKVDQFNEEDEDEDSSEDWDWGRKAWDHTKEASKKAWDHTKEGTKKAASATKDWGHDRKEAWQNRHSSSDEENPPYSRDYDDYSSEDYGYDEDSKDWDDEDTGESSDLLSVW